MTRKSTAELIDYFNTNIPDNTTRRIKPVHVRTALIDLADSTASVPTLIDRVVVSGLIASADFPSIDDALYSAIMLKFKDVVLEDNGSELYIEPFIDGAYASGATNVINYRETVNGSTRTYAANTGGPGFSLNHPARDDFLHPYTIDGEFVCPNPFSTNFKNIHAEAFFVSEDILGMRDGGFDAGAGLWTYDAGWLPTAGVFAHNGATGGLYRTITFQGSADYAISWDQITTVAGGGVTPVILGGTPVVGAASTTSGRKTQTLTAGGSSATLAFSADSGWVGSVDNVRITPVNDSAKPAGIPAVSRARVTIESTGKFNGLSVVSAWPGVGIRGLKAGTFELWAWTI